MTQNCRLIQAVLGTKINCELHKGLMCCGRRDTVDLRMTEGNGYGVLVPCSRRARYLRQRNALYDLSVQADNKMRALRGFRRTVLQAFVMIPVFHCSAARVGHIMDDNPLDLRQGIALLGEAAKALKEDEFLGRILGGHILEQYTRAKCGEWQEYLRQVTDWEIDNYLYRI